MPGVTFQDTQAYRTTAQAVARDRADALRKKADQLDQLANFLDGTKTLNGYNVAEALIWDLLSEKKNW